MGLVFFTTWHYGIIIMQIDQITQLSLLETKWGMMGAWTTNIVLLRDVVMLAYPHLLRYQVRQLLSHQLWHQWQCVLHFLVLLEYILLKYPLYQNSTWANWKPMR